MTNIKDITDYIVVICPKCNNAQLITEWGIRKCRYIGCDNEFEVKYNPELLLIEAVKLKKSFEQYMISKTPLPPKPAKLQKYPNGGWVLVPQGY